MSEVAPQDDSDVVETQPQDQQVETTETEAEETEASEDESNDNSPEAESEEVEESPEDKIARLERESAGKQKAIDRRTAALSDLNKKLEQERQEREKLAALVQQTQSKPEPQSDDFETYDEYVDALAEYRAEQKVAEQQKQFSEQQAKMQQQQVLNERLKLRQEQEADYLQSNPMYKQSVQEVDNFIQNLNTPPDVQDAVIAQMYEGNIPQMIDYFGSNSGENIDKLAEISQMPPWKAAVEIYKIQQSFTSAPKKEAKPIPKPVKAVKGGGATKKSASKMSGKELLDAVLNS